MQYNDDSHGEVRESKGVFAFSLLLIAHNKYLDFHFLSRIRTTPSDYNPTVPFNPSDNSNIDLRDT
jgi:hypothetical protein